ncbi:ArsR/SmtB family transcription factor [Jeotgalibacillus soli]|uniref:HTH arsR-type domain-containing protein n=1 Tax=Jeotgalibacillus soli TaxID=889306 RepID=A0A0C2VN63_9BACL|nr:metalloregulator ArsR/SmtB family transcription factor [Jeotgalibacillus soli]KIL45443.1 hypothetical protein KP78_29870 [Jeotgalibacillus soli]
MDNLNYSSDELADLYRLLGDKTRLVMAKKLSNDYWTVSEFVTLFEISQPLVSQHIRKLKDASLVMEKRVGKRILYRLNPNAREHELILQLLKPLQISSTKQQ